jgi:hypothetical protein
LNQRLRRQSYHTGSAGSPGAVFFALAISTSTDVLMRESARWANSRTASLI